MNAQAQATKFMSHGLERVADRYVHCVCGRKFGPGPYKMKALQAHMREVES